MVLATVSSPKVAEALFDLYLGEQPVSKSAKESAAQTLQRIAASSPASHPITVDPAASASSVSTHQQVLHSVLGPAYYLPSNKGHEIQCAGQAAVSHKASSSASKRQQQQQGSGLIGLPVSELEACVLHMG